MPINNWDDDNIQNDEFAARNNVQKTDYKIIIDQPVEDPPEFRKYSERLSQIIINSKPQFTVGIFGGWGTGKTTMMKSIERKIQMPSIEDKFQFDEISKTGSESTRFKTFLRGNLGLDWIEKSLIEKGNDRAIRIVDSNVTRKRTTMGSSKDIPNNSLTIKIDNKRNQATLALEKLNSVTLTLSKQDLGTIAVKEEEGIKNLYLKSEIITVWFDAWRYENEEFSALVPLVRTIILHLEEYAQKMDNEGHQKRIAIRNLANAFKKMGESIMLNSKANIELGFSGAKASVETDIGKAIEHYKSEGSFFKDQGRIYFHKHVSDYVRQEFESIRTKKIIQNLRMVIFIDDLDRCTPERALELLESIKTFFDIEGIIYVIGMDPSTIDPIIDVKYGKNPRISGLDYLQKIVQLPVQIPVWSEEDLGRTIKEIAEETKLPKSITDKLSEQKIIDLIMKSARLNPRNIKRFMNSLVLSYNISGENFQDIYNEKLRNYIIEKYLESMISIQTFYFRGEKWLQFLKTITDYYVRINFLEHFITFLASKNISYQDLRDKIKDFHSDKYREPTRKTLDIYNKIIDMGDEELFTFLQEASIPLLTIDRIENYLRAVDRKDIDIRVNRIETRSYESLSILEGGGIESFNLWNIGCTIHLPYLKLGQIFNIEEISLFKAKLRDANLFGANLSGADLRNADLRSAHLSLAILYRAKLSWAELNEANLTQANLSGANLSGAILSEANLSQANLQEANLLEANLSQANLSEANLYMANLSGANMLYANFKGANSSASIIIQPNYYETIVLNEKTNFENAICDNVGFINHVSKFTNALPTLVNSKTELRLKLEQKKMFDKVTVQSILNSTNLPEAD